MSEDFTMFITNLRQKKKVSDILGLNIMSKEDYEIADNMGPLLPRVTPKLFETGAKISKEEAYEASYKYLEVFGKEYIDKAKASVNNSKVLNILPCIFTFSTDIEFDFDDKMKLRNNTGKVGVYKAPTKYDEISPLWIAHEHIHALKDINYKEYKDVNVYGDVISLFLDLLMSDQVNHKFAEAYLRNRLYLLKEEYISTKHIESMFSKDYEYGDLYPIYATTSMQYLNSLYYAMKLYELYLDRVDVIPYINSVLHGTKTTREILKELGISNVFDYNTAIYGIRDITSKMAK